MAVFPLSTYEDLAEELARVDRAIDRAGEGFILDHTQYTAHIARLEKTRSEVLDAIARVGGDLS